MCCLVCYVCSHWRVDCRLMSVASFFEHDSASKNPWCPWSRSWLLNPLWSKKLQGQMLVVALLVKWILPWQVLTLTNSSHSHCWSHAPSLFVRDKGVFEGQCCAVVLLHRGQIRETIVSLSNHCRQRLLPTHTAQWAISGKGSYDAREHHCYHLDQWCYEPQTK